jgi:hypothetical protein
LTRANAEKPYAGGTQTLQYLKKKQLFFNNYTTQKPEAF